MGLRDIGGWRFEAVADGTRVGKVSYISRNMKATCQPEQHCYCYATLRSVSDDFAVRQLARWLHRGHAEGWGPMQHLESAMQSKVTEFGTRARGL